MIGMDDQDLQLPALVAGDAAAGYLELASPSAESTLRFGSRLAKHLRPDDVVSLDGNLGAGKTVLTQGIASGLGCSGAVTSPTFTLLMEHPAATGHLALYHFDAYRLAGSEAFCASGLDEYFESGGVCVIEWGSVIADILPRRTLTILILNFGLAAHEGGEAAQQPDQPDWRRIRLLWPDQPGRLARLAGDLWPDAKE
jgi:tRNA threonylcarbamoyladenosine biosynthesis protein TsaE